ncbi:extracellular solute-binding protein [Kineococcus sp. SYSU DK006]|uniref:extracellular solute-binding protein n=1 Tax=Kineococcus sp. SYSU DK006 TaxID=3383127 RepID=UPI003D7E932D
MNLTRRSLLATATGATLLGGLAACGGGSESSAGAGGGGGGDSKDLRLWLMQDSVPDETQAWLKSTFEQQNAGATLTIEVQQWDGIVSKLQTSLASRDESPDVIEFGNTQVALFSSVGALLDISDQEEELGGGDLIQSFIDAGSWEGKLYATPLYAGARVYYYRQDLLQAAGIPVPTSLDELVAAAKALNTANPEGLPDFSGIYMPGADPHTNEGWLFTHGGQYAEQDGDTWKGMLSSPESQAALAQVQDVMLTATKYALDSNENAQVAYQLFNDGKVGMYSALNVAAAKIDKAMWDAGKVGVMALPGLTPGSIGNTFSGGSSIGISANNHNEELSKSLLKLVYSDEFMTDMAKVGGWIPGRTSFSSALEGPTGSIAQEIIENSVLTPNSPQWGVLDGNNVPRDFWVRIAKGEDVKAVAADVDTTIAVALNKG